MRITYLIPGINVAGAERQLLLLAEKIIKNDNEVIIVVMMPDLELKEAFEQIGAKVYCLGMKKPYPSISAIRRFKKIIIKFSPAIIHSHMMSANVFVRIVKMVYLKKFPKLICTSHNTIETKKKIVEYIYGKTDYLSDYNTIISYAAAKRYLKERIVSEEKMHVVYNGVKLENVECVKRRVVRKKEGWGENSFIWTAIGRLEPQKDYLTLISAFALLKEKVNVDILLLIVGGGNQYSLIKDKVKELKLDNYVHLLGKRKDVNDILSASDAFVLSSEYEGFGMVITEAMAMEKPVVATDSGGPREIIGDDERCGILVPPKNSVELSKGMEKIQKMNFKKRTQMGQSGRKKVEMHFDMNIIADKWMRIYTSIQ